MKPKSETATKVDAVVTAGHGDKSGQQTYPQTVVESGFLNHCDENTDERKKGGEIDKKKGRETKSEMISAPSGAVTREKRRCPRSGGGGGGARRV